MKSILRHVERITRHRDQALLDISIAQALAELLPGSTVSIYALRRIDGDVHANLSVRCNGGDFECWPDDEPARPETRIEGQPHLARCVTKKAMASRWLPEGRVCTTYALTQDEAVIGVLEFDLAKPLNRGQQQMVQGFLALHRNFQSLLRYSQIDALTGLLNRKTFDDNLRRYLAPDGPQDERPASVRVDVPQRRRSGEAQVHWLGVIDIDHFKRINDQFGHLYGDEVLILLAKLMKESFRHYDKLFRFGGEEFVVVLRAAVAEDAHRAFDRFRDTVQHHSFPQVGKVTVSIGFTRILASDPPAGIIGRADEALYYAKDNGRNQVHFYEKLAADGAVKPKRLNTEVELF